MPIQTGGQLPYLEFRKRHSAAEKPSPVIWHWKELAGEIAAADHSPYGTLTLTLPDGDHQVVPGLVMTFQTVRPGARTTPHSHTWWHLYLVASGAGSAVFDELAESADLSGGDILLIPGWSVHHFENNGGGEDLLLLSMTNLPQQAALSNLLSRDFPDHDGR